MSTPAAPAPKAPRGRPRAEPDAAKDDVIKVRCTKAEKAHFEAVGGADWLRAALKRAKPKR